MRSLLALVLLSCNGGSDLERSCSGEAIVNCLPYQYSVIEEAIVEPDMLNVGDVTQTAHIRVVLSTCSEGGFTHDVSLRLLDPGTGLEDERLLDILTLVDDGETEGDETAGDGVIDVRVPNPFVGETLPANSDVSLRFQSKSRSDCSSGTCRGDSCRSEIVEISTLR